MNILVPIDFSGASRAALRHAIELGARMKASVDVLHVDETAPPDGDVGVNPADATQRLVLARRASQFVRRQLDALGSRLHGGDIIRVAGRLRGDGAADLIADVARRGGHDLVVVGLEARGAAHDAAVQAIAGLLLCSPCPVLVVRTSDQWSRSISADTDDPHGGGHGGGPDSTGDRDGPPRVS
ncbi:MAG TPA: universal stress protein [Myxococcota bacterium]|nr:universal stress protein [Myxococcota bacterium]